MNLDRDLVGYAGTPPQNGWLGSARLGISLVVNTKKAPSDPSRSVTAIRKR